MSRYVDPKTHDGGVIRISELVGVDGVLDGHTFIGCEINGPAILYLTNPTLANTTLGGPTIDAVLWEVAPHRQIVSGAIHASNCTFERCSFANIGFTGPPEVIQELRNSVH
jgi:hypothetical protein